jgi:hypothetical protein
MLCQCRDATRLLCVTAGGLSRRDQNVISPTCLSNGVEINGWAVETEDPTRT